MKTHMLLIGFSCTGKTRVGRCAFGKANILDSDKEVLSWIQDNKQQNFDHIYEIFMRLERSPALALIEEAENALVNRWIGESSTNIISIGPGIPLRPLNWKPLRAISWVVCFKRSPEAIYESLVERRQSIFLPCPEAEKCDNWDIGVMVDEHRQRFSREVAISKISELLANRERCYGDNDAEIVINNTDAWDSATRKLKELRAGFFPK
jgi:shikimate kinase